MYHIEEKLRCCDVPEELRCCHVPYRGGFELLSFKSEVIVLHFEARFFSQSRPSERHEKLLYDVVRCIVELTGCECDSTRGDEITRGVMSTVYHLDGTRERY